MINRSVPELMTLVQRCLENSITSGRSSESTENYASAYKDLAEALYYLNGGSPVSLEKK